MKAHIRRIATVEAMAVDATLELRILDQRTLIERREVALVDAHLTPHLVTWLDQTVAETIVDAVSTHMDGERAIGVPTIVILSRNGHANRVAWILSKQRVPVVKTEVNRFLTLAVQAVSMTVCYDSVDEQCLLVCHAEVERRDIHGYGDTDVVRIDLGLSRLEPCIADRFVATDK